MTCDLTHLREAGKIEPSIPYRVPRANDETAERWVRSAEARKELKVSTCDLAHMRDAGKIEAKKVGNAYLYKLPPVDGQENKDDAAE